MDYSRNARLEIEKEEINFNELLSEISNNLRFMGDPAKRQVDIRVNIAQDNLFYSDRNRLTIILNNLVSNAIRYQNEAIPDPFVDIQVNIDDKSANISISDNGIGIPKQFQDKIFEMFFRVSKNTTGSGLGLYIVKEAIEKLNGKIELSSEEGKGSTFNIYLKNLVSA